jgi:hypothetical protein
VTFLRACVPLCALIVVFSGQAIAQRTIPESSSPLKTAAQCIQAIKVHGGFKPAHPSLSLTAQMWKRISDSLPATEEERQAATQAAVDTYAELKSKRLDEMAAVGFVSVCEDEKLQTQFLLSHASPELKAHIGLIDASVCMAAAEFLATKDPVNKAVGEALSRQWMRIMTAINSDASQRTAALEKGRETFRTAESISQGNGAYVAQKFASTLCQGKDNQILYLTRWGAPELMAATEAQ